MEGAAVTQKVVRSQLGSTAKPVDEPLVLRQSTVPNPQNFEWVQYGDATARRRARAHVTRGFRRQKAEEAAQAAKARCGKGFPRPPTDDEEDEVIAARLQHYETHFKKPRSQEVVNLNSLGSGRTDPFSSLPVKLDARGQAILHHFFYGVSPVTYNADSKADFSPVKDLSFKASTGFASALHMIIAVGADDLATIQGRQVSRDAIEHRGISMAVVNRLVADGDVSDDAIAGVTFLAAHNLMNGQVIEFNIHMTGLDVMVRLRGGVNTIRKSNSRLCEWMIWIDYAGACNLFCNRRFSHPGPENPLITNTNGVSEKLLASVPKGYDLYEQMSTAFRRLQMIFNVISSGQTELEQSCEISEFVNRIDKELHDSISRPNVVGPRSRRQHIEQSFHIIILVNASFIISNQRSDCDDFLAKIEKLFEGETHIVGGMYTVLFRVAQSNIEMSPQVLHIRLSALVNAYRYLTWEPWQRLKMHLLEFFLNEEDCAGQLQDIWRKRMPVLPKSETRHAAIQIRETALLESKQIKSEP